MFNYIKETIINDQNNVIKDSSTLIVKRGGNYDCTKIVDAKVFKTVGVTGVAGTWTIDPSKFTSDNDIDFRQIAIFIGASKEYADYALANWAEFGKPILINTAADDADELIETLKLALPNDNPLYKVEKSSSNVLITLAESWMIPLEFDVYEHYASTDTLTDITATSGLVTKTDNTPEFGTANWIVENLRFPSYPNVRYNALYADEAPVRGTVYDQYSFQYAVKHCVPGGLSAVGQLVDSITTHVFYVPHADASTFEGKFTGVTFVTDTTVVSTMDPNSATSAAATDATTKLAGLKASVGDATVTDTALQTAIVDAL